MHTTANDLLPDDIAEIDAQIRACERHAECADKAGNVPSRILFRNRRARLVLHRRQLLHDEYGVGFTQNGGAAVKYGEPTTGMLVVRR